MYTRISSKFVFAVTEDINLNFIKYKNDKKSFREVSLPREDCK